MWWTCLTAKAFRTTVEKFLVKSRNYPIQLDPYLSLLTIVDFDLPLSVCYAPIQIAVATELLCIRTVLEINSNSLRRNVS